MSFIFAHLSSLPMDNTESLRVLFPPDEAIERTSEIEELLETLENDKSVDGDRICLYNGFWTRARYLQAIIHFQNSFKAHDTDIILATIPKCGTTWLKALTFTISNRNTYSVDTSPLLTSNPHSFVPFLEHEIYVNHENPDLDNIPSPRLFSTHMPYHAVASSIRSSKCRIIYVCRNPLDHFISHWHFIVGIFGNTHLSLDEYFDKFCQGIHPYGPFWDNVLDYWNAHLENPEKILFLKYEDMKEDVFSHIKKISDFIGFPFSVDEEKQGVVEQVADLCSFRNLKNIEASGKQSKIIQNSLYFRKGEVGDWTNYITREMAKRYEEILQEKLEGSGLKFKVSLN